MIARKMGTVYQEASHVTALECCINKTAYPVPPPLPPLSIPPQCPSPPHKVLKHCNESAGRRPTVEVVEEVIAEHPPPPSNTFQAGSLLAARAPVHMALTAATIGRFPSMQTLQQSQAQAAAADCDQEALPQSQVTCRLHIFTDTWHDNALVHAIDVALSQHNTTYTPFSNRRCRLSFATMCRIAPVQALAMALSCPEERPCCS